MSADGTKQYSVLYNISANTNGAVQKFQELSDHAAKLKEPIKQLANAAQSAGSGMKTLKENENIKLSIDKKTFEDSLKEIIRLAKSAGTKIQEEIFGNPVEFTVEPIVKPEALARIEAQLQKVGQIPIVPKKDSNTQTGSSSTGTKGKGKGGKGGKKNYAGTVDVRGKIDKSDLKDQIAKIKLSALKIPVSAQWQGKGSGSIQKLINSTDNKDKAAKIKLDIDTSLAQNALKRFIDTIRGNSPQIIEIQAQTAGGTTPKNNKGASSKNTSATQSQAKPSTLPIPPAPQASGTNGTPASMPIPAGGAKPTNMADPTADNVKPLTPQNAAQTQKPSYPSKKSSTYKYRHLLQQALVTPNGRSAEGAHFLPHVARWIAGLPEDKIAQFSKFNKTIRAAIEAARSGNTPSVPSAKPAQGPDLFARQIRKRRGELRDMQAEARSVFAQPTPYEMELAEKERLAEQQRKEAEKARKAASRSAQKDQSEKAAKEQKAEKERLAKQQKAQAAPTGFVGSGSRRAFFGGQQPSANLAPQGYHWSATNKLADRLKGEQITGYQSALSEQARTQKAYEKTSAIYNRLQKASDKATRKAQRGQKMLQSRPYAIAALEQQRNDVQAKLNQATQAVRLWQGAYEQHPIPYNFNRLISATQQFATVAQNLLNTDGQIQYWQNLPATVAQNTANATRLSAKAKTAKANMEATKGKHAQATAAVGRYTSGFELVKDTPAPVVPPAPPAPIPLSPGVAQSVAAREKAVNAGKIQRNKTLMPFAKNQKRLDQLVKYRRFFNQATLMTGITPTANMPDADRLRYLRGVASIWEANPYFNKNIPIELYKEIDALDNKINNPKPSRASGGGGGRSYRGGYVPARSRSTYYQTRRWAQPFTGETSFGNRTPMAVDMAKGMGVMFAVGGAMSAISDSFSQAMDYQNTMRTTQAILQNGTDTYTEDSFKNMERTVRDVGVRTKFSAPEVASAAKFLAMAGYNIDAINETIRPIADLALIGDSDLGETADKMTNIMTTFHIDPDRMKEAANIMTTTFTRSNTDLMMLAESAKYGGGVANMYGRNDPNLFADTMAIFGIMGNAGVQASSAGTALRMMYQNIFKPNKKQQALLDKLASPPYGIKTKNADGSNKAMSEILIQMANKIPENEMADVIGGLFRITAQPGATAAIYAAMGLSPEDAEAVANGKKSADGSQLKRGVSSLVSLMQANRASVHGDITGAVSNEKQNTITGLWHQVTSTFTEGIVKAFEKRQGGFEEILIKLRDYLARPETVKMLNDLLDLVVGITKVLGTFVKLWAQMYSFAPGLVKTWVTFQMIMTQFGSLLNPLVQTLSVLNRFKGLLIGKAGLPGLGLGAGMAGAGASVAGSSITGGILGALAPSTSFTANDSNNKKIKLKGSIADRASKAIAAAQTDDEKKNIATRYADMQRRYNRRFGWAKIKSAAQAGIHTTFNLGFLAALWQNIKSGLINVFAGITKVLATIFSPLGITIGSIVAVLGGLAWGLTKFFKHINGTSDAQIIAQQKMAEASSRTRSEILKSSQWYTDMLHKDNKPAVALTATTESETLDAYNTRKEAFKQRWGSILQSAGSDASEQSNRKLLNDWNSMVTSNPLARLAFGDEQYKSHTNRTFGVATRSKAKDYAELVRTNPSVAVDPFYNISQTWDRYEEAEKYMQSQMVPEALMLEGANDPRLQGWIEELNNLYKGLKDKSQFKSKATEKINAWMASLGPALSSEGMTPDQFQANFDDLPHFDLYQKAMYNVLNATANGDTGTLVGRWMAQQQLLNHKFEVKSHDYWGAMSKIINQYSIVDQFISRDGKTRKVITTQLDMLPDGTFDYEGFTNKIRQRIGSFHLSFTKFASMMASVYAQMHTDGLDLPTWKEFLAYQTKNSGAGLYEEDVINYYEKHVANDPLKLWEKQGFTKQNYIDVAMGRKKAVKDRNGNVLNSYDLRKSIVTGIRVDNEKYMESLFNNIKNTSDNNDNNNNSGGGNNSRIDQSDYASNYSPSMATPNQTNIHIETLARFDNTKVASSAEERDLLTAIEERLANVVYQTFAMAANQAQQSNGMSLT